MSQAKAASLTSALFARKGAASPASLVIAELEDTDAHEGSVPGAQSRGRDDRSSQRQKVGLPHPDMRLPLLDYVEAQIAADERARDEEEAKLASAEDAAPVAEDPPAPEVHHEPAASLLARTPLPTHLPLTTPAEDSRPLAKTLDTTLRAQWAAAEALAAAAAEIDAEVEVGTDAGAPPEAAEAQLPEALDQAAAPESEEPPAPAESTPSAEEAEAALDDPADAAVVPPLEAEAGEQTESESVDAALPPAPEAESAEGLEAALPLSSDEAVSDPSDVDAPAPVAQESSGQAAGDADSEDLCGDQELSGDPAGETAASDKPVATPPALETPTAEILGPALNLPHAEEPEPPSEGAAKWDPTAKASDEDVPAEPPVLADLRAREPAAEIPRARPPLSEPRSVWGTPSWRMAAVVLLGVGLGLAGYTLWSGQGSSPSGPAAVLEKPPSESTGPAPASSGGAEPEAAGTPLAITTAEPTAGDKAEAVAPPLASAAPAAADAKPFETSAGGVATIDQAAVPDPSFDIIRIEPNGQSIIAGRADPFSEWIVLNNGEPIGSVRADVNGEWVILPDASLVPGANDFSLVPKAERGKVAIPARESAAPGAEAEQPATGGALRPQSERRDPAEAVPATATATKTTETAAVRPADMPRPQLKPAGLASLDDLTASIRLTPAGGYAVQFASVRRSTAAEEERLRLIRAYPGLLGELDLRVQEASIEGAGTFYRLRSGPLEDLSQAREVCRLLELRGQGCLVVVRASEGEIEPGASPPSQTALTPTQQAEFPD